MRAIENRLIEDTLVRRYEVDSAKLDENLETLPLRCAPSAPGNAHALRPDMPWLVAPRMRLRRGAR